MPETEDEMLPEIPEWICRRCGRPLDDHQLTAYPIQPERRWLTAPRCLEAGMITRNERVIA